MTATGRLLRTSFGSVPYWATALATGLWLAGTGAFAQNVCTHPGQVCEARAAVFAISSFNPAASATRIGEQLLITNRHVVADETEVTVYLPDGRQVSAPVLPSQYPGDLILLDGAKLPPGRVLELSDATSDGALYAVGADFEASQVKVYGQGRATFLPRADRPLSRLHHTASSQAGSSGGALVDANGRLVGIITSGGNGRYEAIPSAAIAALRKYTGPLFAKTSAAIGQALRLCTDKLKSAETANAPLGGDQAEKLAAACRLGGNRQLIDLASNALGRSGQFDRAIELFIGVLNEDPYAVNARIGLVASYHAAHRFEDELVHLSWLLDYAGDDVQVLSLAIQAGVWTGDVDLAQRAFELLKGVDQTMAEAAEQFLTNPSPRPPPR
ncbi:MAG: serine protease [Alphaproteobacteria bacterium]|nr:serine protease [Alphaproteobacteria bacterium]